jgi:DNA repair protein RAD50
VVQSKNGSEVDMRGRCSAGQKVLASLIIRMALADTFSMSCGILALDEPTTNLDSVNIRALCEALARIVQERDDGSGKFMLLVITHDEKFANALERADHFWKLSRDNRGFSRIERVSNY